MPKQDRKTQKILGGSSSNNGQFGSAQAGTFITSVDPAVLQALSAWSQGWSGATISGQQLPTLEEMQGVQYVQTYQLAYLLERGVAEYDAGTNYFHYAVVMKPGTFEIYGSKTDDNIGNALSDTVNWLFLVDLANITATDGDKGDITISGGGATFTIDNGVVTFSKMQNITTSRLLGRTTASAGVVEQLTVGSSLVLGGGSLNAALGTNANALAGGSGSATELLTVAQGGGRVIQSVLNYIGTRVAFTGSIPADNTIPQISEGAEIISQVFTPQRADSTLMVTVNFNMSQDTSTGAGAIAALFDTGVSATDAVRADVDAIGSAGTHTHIKVFQYLVNSVSTAARTFSVRGGGAGVSLAYGTSSIGGSQYFGGVGNMSMTIQEFAPLSPTT